MAIANITGNILTDSGVATSSLLPLTGGTLTGALNGTSAVFSGFLGVNGSPGTAFPFEAYINSSTAYSSTSRGNVMRVYNSNTGANVFAGIELGGAGTANDGLAGLNAIVTGSGSAALTFYTRDGGTFAERLRVAANGNVGIGTSSPVSYTGYTSLHIAGATSTGSAIVYLTNSTSSIRGLMYAEGTNSNITFGSQSNHDVRIVSNDTERMRIQSDGRIIKAANNTQTGQFQIGGQTGSPPNAILVSAADENGPYPIGIKALSATPSQGLFGFFNSANATQGSITINGSDVSYNSFMGSHWSQLSDNSKPEILKGTILEAIDELCKWEGEINDRLPKIKISDTIESKNVYGVFFDWDNMDDFNDMYVAALGAGYIRVNSNEVVSMGDLLQSNGDGTAKVQSDDIMRSSTIAKVVSTQKIETYPDGSYLIAATLHCG
jgi:hypothetical protein